ncbi:MAG: cytochrome c oxidase accessory protein CcoG [Phycisphaerae bacterium]|nr:cytochrome c oxidase accessory protein CcoG [Phycisphaerae bacterium]
MSSEATSTLASRRGADPHEGRSVLSTLNDDGSRRWLRPRLSKGRFLTRRRFVGYALIALFMVLPLLRVHGNPVILLDIVARRFHVFGMTFYPTDTLLLALLTVGVFLTIFWVTALLGRVWCGWACPQTVYMELVFRPIERFFEGAPGRAPKGRLQATGLGRALKFVAYFACAFVLAHVFLAYFVPWEELRTWVFGSPGDHAIGFGVVVFVTVAMLFDFGYFREQVCLVACPYGRLQSVMLDRHSMIIRYDAVRGEPRGPKPSARPSTELPILAGAPGDAARSGSGGDCIDCKMCVTTCPTGIDIRNGLQMECVGCAQCIDACDTVMDKVRRPRGLIRYSSQEAMEGGVFRLFRARAVLYPVVMSLLAAVFAIVLANTGIADVTVLRGLGQPFSPAPDGEVDNTVRVKIVNRLDRPAEFTIAITGVPGARVRSDPATITIGPGQMVTTPAQILAPRDAFHDGRARAVLVLSGPDEFRRLIPFTLLGPRGDDRRENQNGSTRKVGDE